MRAQSLLFGKRRMEPISESATHCPYCALQCGMHDPADGVVAITGNQKFPVNEGGLCAKGWSAANTLRHPDRLLTPLARDENDALAPVGWD
jgi:assimilatory nitrate reductase catalytic subunit